MTSRLVKRHLSLCLVLVMLLTAMLPVSVFAAGSNDEGSAASGGNAAATTMISDYATSFPVSRFWKAMPRPMRKKMPVRMPMR